MFIIYEKGIEMQLNKLLRLNDVYDMKRYLVTKHLMRIITLRSVISKTKKNIDDKINTASDDFFFCVTCLKSSVISISEQQRIMIFFQTLTLPECFTLQK